MCNAERSRQPGDAAHDLLGDLPPVDELVRLQADVAAPARHPGEGLAEVPEEVLPAAPGGLAEGRHIVEFLHGDRVEVRPVQAVPLEHDLVLSPVPRAVEEDAVACFAVPPCTPGLLRIRLQTLWHVVVDDEPDAGL